MRRPPARSIQFLRLTPLSFDSQYVLRWRVDVDADGALRAGRGRARQRRDVLFPPRTDRASDVSASGEVETSDAAGVVRGAVERLPAEMYLRESPLAYINGALRDFAAEATHAAQPTRSTRCTG